MKLLELHDDKQKFTDIVTCIEHIQSYIQDREEQLELNAPFQLHHQGEQLWG